MIPACAVGSEPVAPCGTLLFRSDAWGRTLTPNRRLVSDGRGARDRCVVMSDDTTSKAVWMVDQR